MIEVLLVDDNESLRESLKFLLKEENNLKIVGEIASEVELFKFIENKYSDLIILDSDILGKDCYNKVKKIRDSYNSSKLLIFSDNKSESHICKLFKAGALGYILKTVKKRELLYAIVSTCNGDPYLSSEVSISLLNKIALEQNDDVKTGEKVSGIFSKREMEVLKLIAEGYTNAEIADKLFTSKRTIESHRKNLIEKTQTKNTAALIRYAISKGIIK